MFCICYSPTFARLICRNSEELNVKTLLACFEIFQSESSLVFPALVIAVAIEFASFAKQFSLSNVV